MRYLRGYQLHVQGYRLFVASLQSYHGQKQTLNFPAIFFLFEQKEKKEKEGGGGKKKQNVNYYDKMKRKHINIMLT